MNKIRILVALAQTRSLPRDNTGWTPYSSAGILHTYTVHTRGKTCTIAKVIIKSSGFEVKCGIHHTATAIEQNNYNLISIS
jgi:hypothetical protein